MHPRGNFEGFIRASSEFKWLEAHGLEHWTEFYTDYGIALQKRFFGYFLKGEDNGWMDQPPVQLQVRRTDRFDERTEDNWPIPRTEWTKFYLDPHNNTLSQNIPIEKSILSFDAMGEGITFMSAPVAIETEITGPSAIKLSLSSSTTDADLFVVLRVFSPDGDELVFQGAIDPNTPIAQGWLRASHRQLDHELSTAWRPYHTHNETQPLTPGKKVDLDIEIWPTSIVVPEGYQLAVTIRGKDYEYPHASGQRLSNFKNELKGCGPFLHDDPRDRPPEIFSGETSIHIDPEQAPYILLPIIP